MHFAGFFLTVNNSHTNLAPPGSRGLHFQDSFYTIYANKKERGVKYETWDWS